MRGTVLSYDQRSAKGVIRGDDDIRYHFTGVEIAGNFHRVKDGVEVDFEIFNGQAVQIYPLAAAAMNYSATPVDAQKSKIAAGLFALFLGSLGVHKFYLGQNKAGIIMLAVSILGAIFFMIPTMIIGVIALVEAILYLTKSDADFYEIYEVQGKAWF